MASPRTHSRLQKAWQGRPAAEAEPWCGTGGSACLRLLLRSGARTRQGPPQGGMWTAAFGSPRRCSGAVSRGRDFLLAGACLTCDFPRSASVWEIQCFQRGSAPVTVTLKETLHAPICVFRGCALMRPLLLFCSFPAGRGSFRPIQSSLTKAALSRPIVPKALPPQATGHLASKFLSPA